MKNFLIVLLIILLFTGCSLKRSNPLDPIENDIRVPNEVIGIKVSRTKPTEINITWVPQDDADGYYIYRSLSIDGFYARIDGGLLNSSLTESFVDNSIIPGNWYYYKMSAFLLIDGRKLEGFRSGPKTW